MAVDQPVFVVRDEPSRERVPPFVDRRERCDPQQLLFERVDKSPRDSSVFRGSNGSPT